MGLFNFLRGDFIDVIHWIDDSQDTLVWRFENDGHSINYGAKLTVREGQAAVFIHEGQLADVFPPGLYMLETNNMPVLTQLNHWDHGFQSPFKSEIYFVDTTRITNLKWGTKNPILCRDPEFGPIRLRAFGTYEIRITDPAKFLSEIVGTDGEFATDEISFQIRNIIASNFSNKIAQSGIPVLDMAANTHELGLILSERISPEIEKYGLSLPALYIENISLPSKVGEILDKRLAAGMVNDLSNYRQNDYQRMDDSLLKPSPPPLEHPWHIAKDGQTLGPYSRAEMGRMVAEKKLTRDTFVWTAGQDGWKEANEITELATLFTVLPPPPPKPKI